MPIDRTLVISYYSSTVTISLSCTISGILAHHFLIARHRSVGLLWWSLPLTRPPPVYATTTGRPWLNSRCRSAILTCNEAWTWTSWRSCTTVCSQRHSATCCRFVLCDAVVPPIRSTTTIAGGWRDRYRVLNANTGRPSQVVLLTLLRFGGFSVVPTEIYCVGFWAAKVDSEHSRPSQLWQFTGDCWVDVLLRRTTTSAPTTFIGSSIKSNQRLLECMSRRVTRHLRRSAVYSISSRCQSTSIVSDPMPASLLKENIQSTFSHRFLHLSLTSHYHSAVSVIF